jgi:hypothetical protein
MPGYAKAVVGSKKTVSWNDRLLDVKAFAKTVVCLPVSSRGIPEQQATGCQGICQGCNWLVTKSQYPRMTGYCMPRCTLMLLFVQVVTVSRDKRLLDAKVFAMGVFLFAVS